MDFITLHGSYLLLNLIGTILGASAALTGDFLFLAIIQNKKVSKSDVDTLKTTSNAVWIALVLIVFSNLGLLFLNSGELLSSSRFLAKISIILILLVHGIVFRLKLLPNIKSHIGKSFFGRRKIEVAEYVSFYVVGAISVVSWVFVFILGIFPNIPFGYFALICSYLLALILASMVAYLEAKKLKAKPEGKAFIDSLVIISVTLVVFSAIEVVAILS